MKIAFISDVYAPYTSGVVTSIVNHARKLIESGHEVYLLTSHFPQGDDNPVEGMHIVRLPSTSPSAACPEFRIVSFLGLWPCYKALREICPDIIHIHTPTLMGLAAALFAKLNKVALVQTYHTYLQDMIDYLGPVRFLPKRVAIAAIEWFIRRFYGMSTAIVVPSLPIQHELQRLGFQWNLHVISNGVSFDTFKSAPQKPKKSGFRFLHAGRLAYEKNIDVVLRAFQIVRQTAPDAELWIAGDGPDANVLKQLAVDLGLADSVQFLGRVVHEELLHTYADAQVFVTASTFETEGLVILEAMACGLPIVGVDKLAVPHIVPHGKNGWIAKPFDAPEFAHFMLDLYGNSQRREEFSRQSLELVKQYSIERSSLKMRGLYQNLIKPSQILAEETIASP